MSPEVKQKLKRAAIFGGAGLVAYAISLMVFFPYDRAKEMAQAMAAAQGWDMTIADVGPTWNLGLRFSGITMASRNEKPGTKVVRFTIEEARVALGLATFLGSGSDLKASVDAFGGQIDFATRQSGTKAKPGPFRVSLKIQNVDLEEVPGIRESINMPFAGHLALDAELASDTGKNADLHGQASFTCSSCVAGDGKTPFKVASNPFLAGGLTLPKLRLGDLVGHVAVDKGTAKLEGVEAKSPDGELTLEGEVVLRDPLNLSSLNLYLRFKLNPPFLKAAPTIEPVLQMAGSAGKRPDGFFGLRIFGTFMSPGAAFSTVSPVVTPPRTPPRPTGPATITPTPPPPPPPPPPPASSPSPPAAMAPPAAEPPPSPPPSPSPPPAAPTVATPAPEPAPPPAPPPEESPPPPPAANAPAVVRGMPAPVPPPPSGAASVDHTTSPEQAPHAAAPSPGAQAPSDEEPRVGPAEHPAPAERPAPAEHPAPAERPGTAPPPAPAGEEPPPPPG